MQPQAPLIESLNAFARSITSAAGLTVRRDLTKQQAVGQQRERDRQSKLKSTFLTLVEDAESRIEGIERVSFDIEKQLNLSSQDQSRNAIALAERLLKQTEVSSALPRAHDQARLKDDVADTKADLGTTKKDIDNRRDHCRFKDDIADLKADHKATLREIDILNNEAVMSDDLAKELRGLATKDDLKGLATKDEVRGLIHKDDLRRITTDEVRKHVTEALVPTEQKLASLTVEDANLSKKIKDAEAFVLEKDEERSSRLACLDTNLSDTRTEVNRLDLGFREHERDHAAVKLDLEAQDKLLTEHSACINIWKAEQEDLKLIRHDLDALKADREKVELIRTDLDSLINEERQKDVGVTQEFEKQHEDLARLHIEMMAVKQSQASRTIPNHPPTPPFVNASMSPRESDQQRLQDVEGLRKITQTLELFVTSQQQKFDNLTSDQVVQSMVHQMQQMYPQHPGNLIAWQTKVDSYLGGNLKACLANIESQNQARIIAQQGLDARLQEKTQEISQLTVGTRKIYATLHRMDQDLESLKQTAMCNLPPGPSAYGIRIDELVNRVTTVEASYIKAVADLQKAQTDLVRTVTQLQHRSGIDSARGTPREPTVMSRSSKSIEPTGGICEYMNDSDCSDAPLSQRADRELRRNREDRRPSDPNLKRGAAGSDGEDEDEGGEVRPTNARKVPKRRNVSGQNPSS